MEILLPYICKWITIILVAIVIVFFAKHGLHIIRIRHGKTEVEFDDISINPQEQTRFGYNKGNRGRDFKPFRIFLGSPSGLESTREVFCEEVRFFNETFAYIRNVLFIIEKWEDIPPDSKRSQSLVNQRLILCNCYVLILYDRWGSPPGENDGCSYSSGSEEEFSLASQWLNEKDLPMEKIAVYFKTVEPEKTRTPDEQLSRVLAFKDKIKQEKKLHYNEFSDVEEFRKKIQKFMAGLLDKVAPWVQHSDELSVRDYIGRKMIRNEQGDLE
jgi:hypothetical protein